MNDKGARKGPRQTPRREASVAGVREAQDRQQGLEHVVQAEVHAQRGADVVRLFAIGIFSAFILYDLKRVKDGEETNYISATLGVYLSLYNVFQSLLSILGFAGSSE